MTKTSMTPGSANPNIGTWVVRTEEFLQRWTGRRVQLTWVVAHLAVLCIALVLWRAPGWGGTALSVVIVIVAGLFFAMFHGFADDWDLRELHRDIYSLPAARAAELRQSLHSILLQHEFRLPRKYLIELHLRAIALQGESSVRSSVRTMDLVRNKIALQALGEEQVEDYPDPRVGALLERIAKGARAGAQVTATEHDADETHRLFVMPSRRGRAREGVPALDESEVEATLEAHFRWEQGLERRSRRKRMAGRAVILLLASSPLWLRLLPGRGSNPAVNTFLESDAWMLLQLALLPLNWIAINLMFPLFKGRTRAALQVDHAAWHARRLRASRGDQRQTEGNE